MYVCSVEDLLNTWVDQSIKGDYEKLTASKWGGGGRGSSQ